MLATSFTERYLVYWTLPSFAHSIELPWVNLASPISRIQKTTTGIIKADRLAATHFSCTPARVLSWARRVPKTTQSSNDFLELQDSSNDSWTQLCQHRIRSSDRWQARCAPWFSSVGGVPFYFSLTFNSNDSKVLFIIAIWYYKSGWIMESCWCGISTVLRTICTLPSNKYFVAVISSWACHLGAL